MIKLKKNLTGGCLILAFLSPALTHAAQYSRHLSFTNGKCEVVTLFEGVQQTNAGFGMINTPISQVVGARPCQVNPRDARTCEQIAASSDGLSQSLRNMRDQIAIQSIFAMMAQEEEQYWAKGCKKEPSNSADQNRQSIEAVK